LCAESLPGILEYEFTERNPYSTDGRWRVNAVVAERGQVTIPKALRDKLGIGPKTVLDFREENGKLVAVKLVEGDPVARVTGCVSMDVPTGDWIRDMRDRE
jgi:AbrB family looped-hinge helix DNA binding protein